MEADMEYSQLSKIKRGITIQFIFSEALTVTHSLLFDFQFAYLDNK